MNTTITYISRLKRSCIKQQEENKELRDNLSANNEMFSDQMKILNEQNRSLRKKCDFMLGLLVLFAIVITYT